MIEEAGLYSLAEVREVERMAWACSADAARPDFFFDGIIFWCVTPGGEQVAAQEGELPEFGWWHKTDCNCWLCRRGGESTTGGYARSTESDALSATGSCQHDPSPLHTSADP